MIPGARLIILGRQGAGKGTQCVRLSRHFVVPHISTGDMLRTAVREGTELGVMAQQVMDAGGLVGDEIMIGLIDQRLSALDASTRGYILDGFPRTPAQAQSLEQLAQEQGNEIIAVLIDVPFDLLEKRMTGRRNCPVCNEIYNIYFKPPRNDNVCDLHPEAQLVQRADDNSETVRARLETFRELTQPLIDYYEQAGVLSIVGGTGEPEEIYKDIERIVK